MYPAIAVLGFIAIFIVFLIAREKKISIAYPAAGVQRAFVTTCIDLRFNRAQQDYFESQFPQAFDVFAIPGVALALSQDPGTATSTDPLYTAFPWYNAWENALAISALVNTTSQFILMDHEDCGYYKAYNAEYAARWNAGNTERAKEIQFNQMSTTIRTIQQYAVNNNNFTNSTTIFAANQIQLPTTLAASLSGYWIGLDGTIENIL